MFKLLFPYGVIDVFCAYTFYCKILCDSANCFPISPASCYLVNPASHPLSSPSCHRLPAHPPPPSYSPLVNTSSPTTPPCLQLQFTTHYSHKNCNSCYLQDQCKSEYAQLSARVLFLAKPFLVNLPQHWNNKHSIHHDNA